MNAGSVLPRLQLHLLSLLQKRLAAAQAAFSQPNPHSHGICLQNPQGMVWKRKKLPKYGDTMSKPFFFPGLGFDEQHEYDVHHCTNAENNEHLETGGTFSTSCCFVKEKETSVKRCLELEATSWITLLSCPTELPRGCLWIHIHWNQCIAVPHVAERNGVTSKTSLNLTLGSPNEDQQSRLHQLRQDEPPATKLWMFSLSWLIMAVEEVMVLQCLGNPTRFQPGSQRISRRCHCSYTFKDSWCLGLGFPWSETLCGTSTNAKRAKPLVQKQTCSGLHSNREVLAQP